MNRTLGWFVLLAALAQLAACTQARPAEPGADHGKLLLRQFGCGECHRIPGVATAEGTFGPPLTAIGRRLYLAGHLPNTADNLVRWIRAPQSIDPATAMPDLDVGEAHARDMAAYLRTLR
jgi:cytochrome c1